MIQAWWRPSAIGCGKASRSSCSSDPFGRELDVPEGARRTGETAAAAAAREAHRSRV